MKIYSNGILYEVAKASAKRWFVAVNGQCLDARRMYRTRREAIAALPQGAN